MGLELENVSKYYGDKLVLDKLNLKFEKPGVYGLLGTNGAGKTTAIRIILGILKKNEGRILWNNKKIFSNNREFGYLPEERGLYPKVKVYSQLMYFAKLKGLTKNEAKVAIDYWVTKLDAKRYLNMTADQLSKGNQQKIQFIMSFIHNPNLIIMDEPFSGLDPINTQVLRNIIWELVSKGKYILMSAHIMSIIEEFASDIVILDEGKTVLQGNLQKIKNSYKSNEVQVICEQDIQDILNSYNSEYTEKDGVFNIKISDTDEGNRLLEDVKGRGLIKFEYRKPSLNDIFIEKIGIGED